MSDLVTGTVKWFSRKKGYGSSRSPTARMCLSTSPPSRAKVIAT